jgi:type IV secretory pathway VirB2 component (pilin)
MHTCKLANDAARSKWNPALMLAIAAILVFFTVTVYASASSGGGLPYESVLTQLRNSVTGPVAFTISVIGIVVCAGGLIWGGELNAFFRSMIMLVLAISMIVGANNVLATLFGTGATIVTGDALQGPMK